MAVVRCVVGKGSRIFREREEAQCHVRYLGGEMSIRGKIANHRDDVEEACAAARMLVSPSVPSLLPADLSL